ncbi:outer membrane protein assembly factor BamA [Sphingomonas sp. LY160]|uniref:outer membrane protein assembly factor BamA n=1 Tax=Sphingomonas sp. LY160 TaxID=3095342 RepID=UPI002ADEAAD4|nr:outer membrane protein assembly factor BamA [Sphingomonas sp. LY160]MEA1071131.1 outer membrane protein assembly factor BamA [Sphingomonas sp. LY160]
MISSSNNFSKRFGGLLLAGTVLGGWSAPSLAQDAVPPPPEATEQPAPADTLAPAPAPAATQTAPAATPTPPATVAVTQGAQAGTIRSIQVRGAERLEPETIRAYANLSPGLEYSAESLDQALKDLYATELFADVVIAGGETGNLVITVRENPVINRIVLEGNKRIKADKITPEIKLAPRQIFTRSKVRADVERIIELYRRQGRFAASVEPKIVQLDQNRVDLVFEITEGDKSKVRAINIIGNEQYDDGRLRKEMFTREAGGLLGFIKSNDSYDPDRLAADQQKLRAFYLTQGYADFRVVSALAELTPDRRDFIITYVVEEGPRYKFGTVEAESQIRDFTAEQIKALLPMKTGAWFNAKAVEDTVTALNEFAGAQGYAFADISPNFQRDAENRVMNVTFEVGEAQRTYIERINIQGNTVTRDKVIRREFRLNEGDAFNAFKLKRSQDRIQNLGFFQENLEIKQAEGSSPDRVVLNLDVEEKSTGQLQLSAGYSSLERFVIAASIAQSNFMGKGQQLQAGVNFSRYSKSVTLGFTEPYLFDRNILLGGEVFRRDYNSFNFIGEERNRTYGQKQTGGALRLGFPVTEYVTFGTRYSLQQDNITLDKNTFYTDPDGAGPLGLECNPLLAGRYLCDEIGKRMTSSIGYTVAYDNTNSIRATRGQRVILSQDFAGLGGDVKYLRSRIDGTKYFGLPAGFILSAHAEAGYIHPLQKSPGEGRDAIRLNDRFYGAQLRGFDIRGIGPRIQRIPYDEVGNLTEASDDVVSDSLGGRAYYMGRLELEFPTSAGLRNLGIRPSAFVDVGSLWKLTPPVLTNVIATCTPVTANTTGTPFQLTPGGAQTSCGPTEGANGYIRTAGFAEQFVGNSAKPRLSVGIGVNWTSPFGPLRIDIAKALLKQEGDDTKLFSFNVGTQF